MKTETKATPEILLRRIKEIQDKPIDLLGYYGMGLMLDLVFHPSSNTYMVIRNKTIMGEFTDAQEAIDCYNDNNYHD